jgi:sugar/nucleoside kinase (ribokinase family)
VRGEVLFEEKKEIDCTVVGDAMLDITVKGTTQLKPRGTSYCETISIQPGGSGNVAAGLSKLGGHSAFIGKIGKDALGSIYIENLKKMGIQTHPIIDKQVPTGTCIVLVDEFGERSFIVFRGANNTLKPTEIEGFRQTIANSKFLYVSGYSLVEHPQAHAVKKAVHLARKEGVKVVFDFGSYNIVKDYRETVEEIITDSDVLFPNYEEAKALVNKTAVSDIAKGLSELAPIVFLKLGEQGCVVINGRTHHKLASQKVKPIDTTGAGDAFAAAAIYGLTHKLSLTNTGILANWFASRKVLTAGPRVTQDKKEVNLFLRSFS